MVDIYRCCLRLLVFVEVAGLHTQGSRHSRVKDDQQFTRNRINERSRTSSHKNRPKLQHRSRSETDSKHGPIFPDSGISEKSISYSHKIPQKDSINREPNQHEPKKYRQNCCQNGGDCILGSFCVCPKEYYGQYCEVELEKANCGQVKHRGWMKLGCSLCFCYAGKMTCLQEIFAGCENHTKEEHGKSLEIKIYPPKEEVSENDIDMTSPENYFSDSYYYYEDEADGVSSARTGTWIYTTWTLIIVFYTCAFVS